MRFELRLLCIASLLLLLVALCSQRQAIAEVRRSMDGPFTLVSGRSDFDVLAGSWEVLNRRLKVRHAGSRDWDEFRGRASMRPILGGLSEFFGGDVDGGRPVRVRYLWSRITKDTARWEQALSLDGGRTWETNWVMDLLRIR